MKNPIKGAHLNFHLDCFAFLLPVAGPGDQVVGDRLVAGPPGVALNVLHGWGHLDAAETLGTQHLLALQRYVVPGPFKQVDNHLDCKLLRGQDKQVLKTIGPQQNIYESLNRDKYL